MKRSIFTGPIRGAAVEVNVGVERALNDLGGVRSPEMRASGAALARSIRKVLSVSGGGGLASNIKTRATRYRSGTPSAPGQPPRRQTGHLAKSIKSAPSGDGIKVGPLAFTSLFMEEGVNAVLGAKRVVKSRKLRDGRRSTRARVRTTKKNLVIAARPFMAKALDAVRAKLPDVFVREGRRRLENA